MHVGAPSGSGFPKVVLVKVGKGSPYGASVIRVYASFIHKTINFSPMCQYINI